MSKTILIAGASRGLGRIWAEAFLKRGDRVAATARNIDSLNELVEQYGNAIVPIALDVHDREACFAAVDKAKKELGRIDVLVNNAGYGLQGAIEDTSEQEARNQFETNFFGSLWLLQAIVPVMRDQKGGHIVQVSSFLGVITLPTLGLYNASKFAIEGLCETLASEVKPFGIKVSLVEPNAYATEFWGGSSYVQTTHTETYVPVLEGFKAGLKPEYIGKPEATVDALLQLVDTENPPLRLLLGKVALYLVKQNYQNRMKQWEDWNEVAVAAHGH
ncbi:SDR family NAD(P)-dependent oxidoreductase [Mucilaginibacter sp. SG564]|uniref:SDR family NAD(P)-dependent oxidoreductase n=1 Tax=Mucilaginibacter sp. SG564 TaxID=2587022 RepID=UPI00155304E8|nr:SDR family NAD(P)-dependent oxidoreductase [Mucilaginibacter sp. SG564]NOW95028.1 NAD(P)-dependent dehydrogenase (short-subunit alcohol dehydrogenase family) [Mucilaginibacter sp. SG564]